MTTADLAQTIDDLDDVDEIDDSHVYVSLDCVRRRKRRMCAGFISAIILTFHHECHVTHICHATVINVFCDQYFSLALQGSKGFQLCKAVLVLFHPRSGTSGVCRPCSLRENG